MVLPPGEYSFVCDTPAGYTLVSPTREVRGEPVTDAHPYSPVAPQRLRLATDDYRAQPAAR